MEQTIYCPSCGQQMERRGCRFCCPPPALLFGETAFVLEWYELAGVKLARIKQVIHAIEEAPPTGRS